MAKSSTEDSSTDQGISAAAKVGIAIAAAFGIVLIFSAALYVWWRRRAKQELAKDMVNFVDGDIVNLVDRGRFEKPSKPSGAYDPYYESATSSQSLYSAPQYFQAPTSYSIPLPEERHDHYTPPPADHYAADHYAAASAHGSVPVSRNMPSPSDVSHTAPAPLSATEQHSWANTGRHPWSPPDYDAHSPVSVSSVQEENGFSVHMAQNGPAADWGARDAFPVEGLPAVLPEPKPQPQAELPAREGQHGWGHEQELPAPQQAPLRRQHPLLGAEIDEQKFLLADIMPLRQQKSRSNMSASAG